ncbi:hypothetical protein VCHA54P499_100001 [Vibrio chagasii]|nr:hypothetical protein VCHA54P499_100001 [Vibrio chagasii]CAH6937912.1 hypothetical protein VCHA53O466_120001 [Vibrio chagasii]CAH7392915.1 hypothetical protein VCHA39P226_80001 [Vibrio chagasii]CAH7413860.1 hypothetical protein VCHA52P456_80028 [Vibrio chagasii]CAH7425744.1 hypothetical protein VCHA52P453_80185 [Vibrio chagasii]
MKVTRFGMPKETGHSLPVFGFTAFRHSLTRIPHPLLSSSYPAYSYPISTFV